MRSDKKKRFNAVPLRRTSSTTKLLFGSVVASLAMMVIQCTAVASEINIRFIQNPSSTAENESTLQRATVAEEEKYYEIIRDGEVQPVIIKQSNNLPIDGGLDPLTTFPSTDRSVSYDISNALYIVQFHTQLLPEHYQLIIDQQLEVVGKLTKQSLLVRGSGTALQNLQTDRRVRWTGTFTADDKVLIGTAETGSTSATSNPLRSASATGESADTLTAYNVTLVSNSEDDHSALKQLTSDLNGHIIQQDPASSLATVSLSPDRLRELAAHPSILSISPWTAPQPDMNNIRALSGVNFVTNNTTIVPGFTGKGVRGEILDTSYVDADHPAFSGANKPRPKPHRVRDGRDSFHATAVYGIVYGDGDLDSAGGIYKGIMPDGYGIYASYQEIGYPGRAAATAELIDDSQPRGSALDFRASFQTASDGGARTFFYNDISRMVDKTLFDNNILVFQSQSNAGNQDSRPEAWAKNIVAVGGIFHLNDQIRDNDFWCNSSHSTTCGYNNAASIGPADDGRIKPDLTNAYDATRTTDTANPSTSIFRNWNGPYIEFSGTSGSTPITAGNAGIMIEMWSRGLLTGKPEPTGDPDEFIFANRPAASTGKAILINTAEQYPINQSGVHQNIPRSHQGWGSANVQNIYNAASSHPGGLPIVVDEELTIETGQTHAFQVTVSPPNNVNGWVKATLVYKDPPAVGNPSIELVNDITLRIISPDGVVYWGNHGLQHSNWSISGGGSDSINNVENIFLENAQPGEWDIEVIGVDIGTDAFDDSEGKLNAVYSLVVTCGDTQVCSNVIKQPGIDVDLGADSVVSLPDQLSLHPTIRNFSTDADLNSFNYEWQQIDGPEDSYSTILQPNELNTTITFPTTGAYTFALSVFSNGEKIGQDQISVFVYDSENQCQYGLESMGQSPISINTLTLDGDFTIEAWMKFPLDQPVNHLDGLVANNTAGDAVQDINFYSRRIRLHSNEDRIVANFVSPAGVWTHYAITREHGQLKIYINGILDVTSDSIWTDRFTINEILSTTAGMPSQQYSATRIEELRIWRVAREQQEISKHMRSSVRASDEDLVAYYSFNDVVNPATDTTGNGHSGIVGLGISQYLPALYFSDQCITPLINIAPIVDAGIDQTITLPDNAELSGNITDDGLSEAPLRITWHQISGPGITTFFDTGAATTSANFSLEGVYILELTADDGEFSSTDQIQITVNPIPLNTAPTVTAGIDRTVQAGAELALNGTVQDDGFPSTPGRVSTTWSVISGPGDAIFNDPNALSTTAIFNAVGTFVLQLSATDGDLTSTDQVSISVTPPIPPVSIFIEGEAALATTNGGALQTQNTSQFGWSNSAQAFWFLPNFGNTLSVALNNKAGKYRLRINFTKARDYGIFSIRLNDQVLTQLDFYHPSVTTALEDFGEVNVPANSMLRFTSLGMNPAGVPNRVLGIDYIDLRGIASVINIAPQVDAGNDQTITLPDPLTLQGHVIDDGRPAPSQLSITWSTLSGPGTVSFAQPNALNSNVTFSAPGEYELQLSASDGALTSVDALTVTVGPAPPNQPPQTDAGSDQSVAVGEVLHLQGSAIDDSLPLTPGEVTVAWSTLSGPGTANFSNPNSLDSNVTFDTVGIYTLLLTSSDGELQSSDTIVVNVTIANPPVSLFIEGERSNATANGGVVQNQSLSQFGWSNNAQLFWFRGALRNTLLLPLNNIAGRYRIYINFTKARDYGIFDVRLNGQIIKTVDLYHPTVTTQKYDFGTLIATANSNLTFTSVGTNSSGIANRAIGIDYIQLEALGPIFNTAPQVNAGPDQVITLPDSISLRGIVSDDGLPTASVLRPTWTKESGPGIVAFENSNSENTTANFSQEGTYTIRLTVTDGALSSSDLVEVKVNPIPPNTPPEVNAGTEYSIPTGVNLNLLGTVNDDNLPLSPGLVAVNWSFVSGPGNVVFADSKSLTTSAIFDTVGSYVLRLQATDGELTASDTAVVNVTVANPPMSLFIEGERSNPVTNGGAIQTQNTAQFGWSNASQIFWFRPQIGSTFSIPLNNIAGRYRLRINFTKARDYGMFAVRINDQLLRTIDLYHGTVITQIIDFSEVVVDENSILNFTAIGMNAAGIPNRVLGIDYIQLSALGPIFNTPPLVDAGPNQEITMPNSAMLLGSTTDDGLPTPTASITTWSTVSGPGNVSFNDVHSINTSASFSTAGTYVLELSVSDGALTTTDQISIVVNPIPPNTPPQINAGDDRAVAVGNEIEIRGIVSDDGLPLIPGNVSVLWSLVSGPGEVSFSNDDSLVTTVNFNTEGTYVLQLLGNDSELIASDTLTVTVTPANPPMSVFIEGENAGATASSGTVLPQNYSQFGWSNSSQIYWFQPQINTRLSIALNNIAGTYQLGINFTKARDYGIFDISVNGQFLQRIDFYNLSVVAQLYNLGEITIPENSVLTFTAVGMNPLGIANRVLGIDYINLQVK